MGGGAGDHSPFPSVWALSVTAPCFEGGQNQLGDWGWDGVSGICGCLLELDILSAVTRKGVLSPLDPPGVSALSCCLPYLRAVRAVRLWQNFCSWRS